MGVVAVEVIGRDAELASIVGFVDSIDAGPAALVLSGEPGIGKTVLWETGVAHAKERFARVLSCRGVEAEASLSFTGLSELLSPVLDEAAPLLLPPRRRALEVALLIVEPGDSAPDPHAIGLAVLDVLRVLSASGTLLVALDDVQWLDPASAGALQLALRRLRDEPIGALATLLTGGDDKRAFELRRSFPDERLAALSVGPLSSGAVYRLLKDRLGLELARPELARVQEATAGNPFFALELGRELVRTGTRPAAGQALHVPESLRGLLGGRLARLPPDTGDVLLEVAALAKPTVELVAAAHGDRERVVEALEAAVREGVLELDDSRLRFVHPLLASICYERAPVWKRRAVHGALARAVADVEERAQHLALAAERLDPGIALELDNAVEHAAARGATAAAAGLAELAADHSEGDAALARRRRLRAAILHRLSGDPDRATSLLERARSETPPGPARADVLFALAMTLGHEPSAMIALCEQALAEAADDDATSVRILAFLTWAHVFTPDVRASLACAREALERAERVGEPALLAVAIGRAGHAEIWACEVTPGLLERGVEIEATLDKPLEFLESPKVPLAELLMGRGEFDRARALLAELEADLTAWGDEASRVEALWLQSLLEWLAGRWPQALELGATAHELAMQIQFPHAEGWAGRARAVLETDLGLIDEARASAEECLAWAEAASNDFYAIAGRGALGRLELAVGNLEAAGAYLRDLPRRLLDGQLHDPSATIWADAIETLVRLGEPGLAGSYLDHYAANAKRLRSPPAVAGAERCRGLLAAAEGDLEGAFVAYERALAELAGIPQPLELGRTLLCLGSARRQAQQKSAAREALEQALAIFAQLGARPWAEKAQAELRRISGRRPAGDELTETELRVAELATRGRSNRQIATELFMGVSTVEMHLSRVYRKLGIRSRAALTTRLAIVRDEAAQP
jgi:ATP/maltotriose-dependent transcriptional regulator MalT